jgi:serpin B
MKNSLFPVLVLLLLTFSSCNWFSADEPKEIELSPKSATLVESNNSFGYNFFEEVLKTESAEKNIMVSPLSVSQALSMAINGAAGNTFTQMQNVMGFGDLTLSELNECNQTIVSSLVDHDPKVKMEIANSVWYRNDFAPKTPFIDNNKKYYGAMVSSYDPAKPDAAKDKMNKWVDDKTNGKIDKIIDEVTPDNVMFLINAIYFKAKWKSEFKKSDTRKETFTLDNGTAKEVETMIGEVKLAYCNEEKFSIVKLPYGAGKFNLLIFLPEEGYTTADIVSEIEKTDFEKLKALGLSERDLWLPKFEFSYENKLNDELDSLGMSDALDPALANFSGISDIGLYISRVMHKTYIKTDEEGSEAAAVTSITFDLTSVGPEGIIKIDRSFLFAIVEEDTQSILFMGKVFDPTLNGN